MRRIRSKLLAGFVCVVLIIGIQALVGYLSALRVERLLNQACQASVAEISAGEQMTQAAVAIRVALSDADFVATPEVRGKIDEQIGALQKAIHVAQDATRNSLAAARGLKAEQRVEEEEHDLKKLHEVSSTFTRLSHEWAALSKGELSDSTAVESIEVMSGLLEGSLLPAAEDYQKKSIQDIASEGLQAVEIVRRSRYLIAISAVALLSVAMVASWLIGQAVAGPLTRMTREANEISQGAFGRRFSPGRGDEIGLLGESFNRVLDALQASTITREELEARITERTVELDRFFTLSLDMLCIADFSGKFVRVNPSFEKVLGYPLSEFDSKAFMEFVHPDDRESTEAEMQKMCSDGDVSLHFENRYRHQNGSWRTLSWNSVPVKEIGLIYAAAHDITELRRVEQALRKSEEELRLALAEQRRARESERQRASRMLHYQQALLRLRDLKRTELTAFIKEATEECARHLETERVSVWFINAEETEIRCRDLFEVTSRTHTEGAVLSREQYPAYFQAIRGLAPVVADDAIMHTATREFADDYLWPFGIMSMLDIPIRAGTKLVGVLCCEHTGAVRKWSGEEVEFASGVASALMLGIEQYERAAAEEKLRSSEAYNRSIVESSEDCLKVLSLDGHLISMADTGLRILGYPDFASIAGMDWTSIWHGADREAARQALAEARAGRTGRFQGFCPTYTGVPKWWDVMVSPILGTDRLLAVSRDITEQRAAAEEIQRLNAKLEQRIIKRTGELKASEERFRLMIEQVQDYAIYLLSIEGIVTTWNAGAQRAKGYTAEEIVGRHYSCFYTPEDVRAGLPARQLAQAVALDRIRSEGWRMRKDGTRFWAESTITVIRDESGSMRGFAKVIRDLSERREAEIALQQALETQRDLTRKAQAGEKARSEFLAIMSHEVRTPMNGIIGYADLLASSPDLNGEKRQYVDILLQSGQALLRILDDILDFSGLEAGSLRIDKEAFSPRQLIEDVRLLLDPIARRKGLRLETKVASNVPPLLVSDPGRLRQVLINLGGNAIKFTETGSVTIQLEPAEVESRGTWDLTVSDTGPGLTEEQQKKIFHPFVQGDGSTSRRYGGTGLGLAISRRLTELMGGTLSLISEPGHGCRFIARLPMKATSTVQDEIKPRTIPNNEDFARQHPLKILVAEDDSINLKLTLTLLSKLGYKALAARNGREAVEMFSKESPNCILMDLQMPEMDGIEATKAIRELERTSQTRSIYILALTANTDAADRRRCLDVGMAAHVNKPIRRERLCELLAIASEAQKNGSS